MSLALAPNPRRLIVGACVSQLAAGVLLTGIYVALLDLLWLGRPEIGVVHKLLLFTPLALILVVGYTWWRLRHPARALERMRRGETVTLGERERAARDVLVLPVAFLLGGALVALGVTLAVAVVRLVATDSHLVAAIQQLIYHQTFILAFGMVTYLALRRLARPVLVALRVPYVPLRRRFGFRSRLALWVMLLAFLVATVLLVGEQWLTRSVMEIAGQGAAGGMFAVTKVVPASGMDLANLFVVILFSALIGSLLGQEIRTPALAVTRQFDLIGSQVERGSIEPIPVHSATEVGRIAMAYNRLVERLDGEHTRLSQYAERVRRNEAMRARFLANVSHELRTPLNSILGFSDILLQGFEGELSPRQRDALEITNKAGELLLGLINDILLMARFEAERVVVNPVVVTFAELQGTLLEAIGSTDRDRVDLDVEAALSGGHLLGDRPKLERALLALVGHALDVTGEGRVLVQAGLAPQETFWVRVQNPAAPRRDPEGLEKLFEGFRRPDQKPGTGRSVGLGLPLARKIARLHGGEVAFVTEGSTCWLEMRLPGAWKQKGGPGDPV